MYMSCRQQQQSKSSNCQHRTPSASHINSNCADTMKFFALNGSVWLLCMCWQVLWLNSHFRRLLASATLVWQAAVQWAAYLHLCSSRLCSWWATSRPFQTLASTASCATAVRQTCIRTAEAACWLFICIASTASQHGKTCSAKVSDECTQAHTLYHDASKARQNHSWWCTYRLRNNRLAHIF